jgi:hypothetical protein
MVRYIFAKAKTLTMSGEKNSFPVHPERNVVESKDKRLFSKRVDDPAWRDFGVLSA